MAETLPDTASTAAKAPDLDDPTAGTDAFGNRRPAPQRSIVDVGLLEWAAWR